MTSESCGPEAFKPCGVFPGATEGSLNAIEMWVSWSSGTGTGEFQWQWEIFEGESARAGRDT